MASKISLYNLISNDYPDLHFVNTIDMMNTISHQIEDVVMKNNLPVDFYAGFQRYSMLHRQRNRYERLAKVVRRIYVFGVPDDDAPDIPGVEYVPLQEEDLLAKEWFLVVNTPDFFTSLLTRQVDGTDEIRSDRRRFEGLWTYDSQVVGQANLLLAQFLGKEYRPIVERNYEQQNKYLVSIASDLVTRLELSSVAHKNMGRMSKAVSTVAGSLALDQTLDNALEEVAAGLKTNYRAQTVTIWQLDDSAKKLALIGAAGIPGDWREAVYRTQPLDSMKLMAAQALTNGRTEYVANTRQANISDIFDPAAQAIVAVPLKARGRIVGALQLTAARTNAFSSQFLNVLESVGAQVGLALISDGAVSETLAAQPKSAVAADSSLDWTVLDSTLDSIILLNADKTISYVNSAARQLLNMKTHNLLGQPATALNYPQLVETITSKLDPESGDGYAGQISLKGREMMINAAPVYRGSENGALTQIEHWSIVLREKTVAGDAVNSNGNGHSNGKLPELTPRLQAINKLLTMLPSLGELSPTQSEAVNRISQLHDELEQMANGVPQNGSGPITSVQTMSLKSKESLLTNAEAGLGNTSTFDVAALLQEIVAEVDEKAISVGIQVQPEISANLPTFTGDAAQLHQAVLEMVNNAIQYSPDGANVRLIAGLDQDTLIVAVRDSGLGIWLKDVPRLFEKHFRVDNPQTQAVSGEGLGLTLVKTVAENHGGKALVESRVGRGTMVVMKLPLEAVPQPA